MLKKLLFLFPLLCSFIVNAQDESLLIALTIPTELRENANAVVRNDDINITIAAYNKMVYTNKRVVTILNSSADNKHGAVMGYDKNISIKKLEAKIYNSFGKEIKKIKKNDFEDVSAVDGGTLYSDSRVKYLNYTPTSYPYTVVFETEVEYNSTAFIPGWRPIEGFYTSTENASYKVVNPSGIEVKMKTTNFENFNIKKTNDFEYSAQMLKSIKPEAYSPDFAFYAPTLKVALNKFYYEGYSGESKNWLELGKWMYDELLVNRTQLSEQTKDEIKLLVDGVNDTIEKAKIVYKYVQERTRYISVQEGIGGIQPIDASQVDKVKYGDCKGLTNYTKALMDVVGVKSYYSRVYGSSGVVDVDKDFVTFLGQTNHVILNIPNGNDDIWLECTSQTLPFGYNANFTDDRDVFVITPEGGKIVHTKVYKTEDNLLQTNATIKLEDTGDFEAVVLINSKGTQYGYHEGIQRQTHKNQELHYKNEWSHINALNISAMEYHNDKDNIVFKEEVKVNSERYASKAGNRLLLQPNFFNRIENVPTRYDNRLLPFELERGFVDVDSYEIILPDTLEVETLMNEVNISNKFGEYSASIVQNENNKLVYTRKFLLHKGFYEKEDYEAYRAFWLEVVKNDKSKIVLKYKS
jgi:transglutaminase-like putative cysteine protease